MRPNLAALLAVILLILGLAAYMGFHHYFEWSEDRRDLGYSPEALRNPWLAAENFLKKRGNTVHHQHSLAILDHLPASDEVLFVPRLPLYLSPEREQRLERWLRDGGHLITVFNHVSHDQDKAPPFLERFGVRGGDAEDDDDHQDDADADPAATAAGSGSSKDDEHTFDALTEVHFEGRDRPVHLELGAYSGFYLRDAGGKAAIAGDAWGARLLDYSIDQGQLTVLSSTDFLENRRFARFDHALFLDQLVGDRTLWIIDAGDYPSLPSLLWQRYPALLVASLVLILARLWQAAGRFGPLRAGSTGRRRHLGEHLDAAGRHHWRMDRGQTLLAQLRQDLENRLHQRHGAWTRQTEASRCAWLASLTGLAESDLNAALFAPSPRDEQGYWLCVRTLHQLRKSL